LFFYIQYDGKFAAGLLQQPAVNGGLTVVNVLQNGEGGIYYKE